MESVASSLAEFVHLDGTKVTEKIIGIGGTNIVIEDGIYAIKLPRLSRFFDPDGVSVLIDQSRAPGEGDHDYHSDLINALDNEKAIYRRIGPHIGVTPCYNLSSTEPSVQMLRMGQNLQQHLKDNRPDRKKQLAWSTQLAEALAHIHSRGVIVADVNPSNIVLDDDSNVRFIDFSESTLMALDWDLKSPDEHGYSILSDIGQLGAVIFLIVTGRPCKFTLEDAQDSCEPVTWPQRNSLPETANVWLGALIEKCWTKGFRTTGALAAALRHVEVVQ
ncbi:uncharacterized protein HMPREF1541_04357 [Cyphellophora europaea CBS 101466]|uniref:Protein kinase domain-containing protein n=1 Tax=Cyphellophora europaea (strain CBS 101466) TaxID=1220924 RepID=W2RUG1_CYPE1|nr:uncharacterized protein HMPREF1541_04357 [Cyphellophora europaea CBS 101466]ETN40082.1 hypothetical protein HMPREF1541_04357 [Cyphellophora europaea CBS 101466]